MVGQVPSLGVGSTSADVGVQALRLAGLGLGAAIAKGVGGVCATYTQGRIAGGVAARLRLDILDAWLARHRLRRPWRGDHAAPNRDAVGEGARGLAALTSRVQEIERGLGAGLLGGARAVAQLLPLAVLLVVLSPRLSACALAVVVPFALVLSSVRRGWKRANARAAAAGDALLEAADDVVRHAELWVTFGATGKARANVAEVGDEIVRRSARVEAGAVAISATNEILGALALVLVLLAARAGYVGERVDGGTLLGFAVAFFLAYRPLRELAEARLSLLRTRSAIEELESSPATSPEPEPAAVAATGWRLEPLLLTNLRLGAGHAQAISARIEPGSVVAVRGATGAGKTTLLRALLGLEAAASGEILYGDRVLDGPPGPASRPFSWVPQDAPLLADTLEANVALGADGAGLAEGVLERLGAARLSRELGLARLGAGGRAVSGGERQWINLARAVATRQPVLLLDEPTSGLDPASQARVLDAIERLRGERTVIVVTHRPEPLQIADQVILVGPASD